MELVPVTATIAVPLLVVLVTVLGRRHGLAIPYRVSLPLAVLAAIGTATVLGPVDDRTGLRWGVVAGFATGVGFVHYLDDPRGAWGQRLRSRFIMGVPWGTIVTIAFVSGVYLFVQGGIDDPYAPLAIPFTSWSYYYPLGVVTAPFAHSGFGHLVGNLIGTVVLAPIAEYAWSHFPTERGQRSFGSWRTNPYVRAFVLFPLGVLLVGLGTSIFSWGAIIGFSGVVFAFAGFGVVRYPIATVVALTARGAVRTTYHTLRNPVVVETASPSFGPPWWVGVAIQGHLLGLLLGAALGIVLLAHRRNRPSAARLFLGVVLLGFSFTLYALWWYRDPTTFVLYRGLGVVLIVTLAVLLTGAIRSTTRELFEGVTRHQFATMVVLLPIFTMGLVAFPVNATTLDHFESPDDAIEIDGYQIFYAEDVTNERVNVVDIELLNETTAVAASGVIVVSETRHVWTEAVSAGSLAFWGERPVRVGDLGWSETVWAKRTGWRVAGAKPVYHVSLKPPGGDYVPVFASPNRTAAPTIEHRNITIEPVNGSFELVVSSNGTTLGRTPMPVANETRHAGGLGFERQNQSVFAVRNGTRVQVAAEETYE